jgi:PiT family inorganic phosphate transporter
MGLVEIAPPPGLAAESASAAVILASSQPGFALSTTHVATGSILGTGVGRPGAQVRWRVAGRIVAARLITLLFLIVLAGVVLGITFIVASGLGKALSFEHIYPTIVNK